MRHYTFSIILIILFPAMVYCSDREFGSVGAQVVPISSGEVVVLQVVDESPAAKAGLRPGDLIIKINDTVLKGLDFNTATREYLWGFVGEPVHFTWLRPGETTERNARLVRIRIDPELLEHPGVKMLNPKK